MNNKNGKLLIAIKNVKGKNWENCYNIDHMRLECKSTGMYKNRVENNSRKANMPITYDCNKCNKMQHMAANCWKTMKYVQGIQKLEKNCKQENEVKSGSMGVIVISIQFYSIWKWKGNLDGKSKTDRIFHENITISLWNTNFT